MVKGILNKDLVSNCKRCGFCCKYYEGLLWAEREDIERWKKEKRYDILKYIEGAEINGKIEYFDELWFNPKTGDETYRCPFLRKVRNKPIYKCKIHETKPNECREFYCGQRFDSKDNEYGKDFFDERKKWIEKNLKIEREKNESRHTEDKS